MKLIVAEKPSVAASLARIVGATKKNDGYFEGHNFIVTYCIGHLLQLAMPDIYGYKTWQFNDLPIIPDKFKYVTAPETVKQCNIVCDLMADMRVDGIICATDSAREGELIFRRVFSYAIQKSSLVRNKPVYRLWVSSTEDAAYRHGLKTMRPDSEYNNLYQAGNSRAIADWIIGINGTRAYTTAFNVKLPVGRVKTPILAFIVQREQEIENFKPELYYRLTADHGNFKTFFKTSNKDVMGDILSSYRLSEAVVNAYSHTEKKKAAPLLYNTTQIMKDANALFGYTADETLSILQSLYDNKLTTYPRVESSYLTSDMVDVIHERAAKLAARFLRVENITLTIPKRLVNDKASEEHYAIVPTDTAIKAHIDELPRNEKNIFLLIMYRLFAALSPDYEYYRTELKVNICDHTFSCTGSTPIRKGYKEVEEDLKNRLSIKAPEPNDKASDEDFVEQIIPSCAVGDILDLHSVSSEDKYTKPPQRYTDSSLLSAMENAGRTIAEINLRKTISDCGIGTPATRAEIITSLIRDGYAERIKKHLIPTEKGKLLISKVDPSLCDAVLTAKMEEKLNLIAQGNYQPRKFQEETVLLTQKIIRDLEVELRVNGAEMHKVFRSANIVGKCPRCGNAVIENAKGYRCENTSCGFAIWKDNNFSKNFKKPITTSLVTKLLANKSVPIKGLTSSKGNKFNCDIALEDTGKFVNIKLLFDV